MGMTGGQCSVALRSPYDGDFASRKYLSSVFSQEACQLEDRFDRVYGLRALIRVW